MTAALALKAGALLPWRSRMAPAIQARSDAQMYGLIGKMTAVAGRRDDMIGILLEGTGQMPGCLSYVVATDPNAPDAIWITEVWDSEASHKASLALPAVREAIKRGRPLIASFDQQQVTTPVGGYGLGVKRQA